MLFLLVLCVHPSFISLLMSCMIYYLNLKGKKFFFALIKQHKTCLLYFDAKYIKHRYIYSWSPVTCVRQDKETHGKMKQSGATFFLSFVCIQNFSVWSNKKEKTLSSLRDTTRRHIFLDFVVFFAKKKTFCQNRFPCDIQAKRGDM